MKASDHSNMIYSFIETKNPKEMDKLIEKRRQMNSYDFMANKLSKSKNFLLEKIKSSSATSFDKLTVSHKTKQSKAIAKKIEESKQDADFAKVSYRLKNFQYFDDKSENASDFQKRDLTASKSKSQSNNSLNTLHISHLNLDSTFKNRGQSRKKSATNELFIGPASKQNIQSSRNMVQKNYIDLNIQGPIYQSQTNFFNQSPNYTMYTPTNRVQSSKSNHHNLKIINDSNKFLEDVLAHTKRKSINFNQYSNSSSYQSFNPNSPTQPIQNNYLVINRTIEEKSMFPDKLIMDRRKLNFCPRIEGEDTLKLINYQHNQIRIIQNLDNMKNLIFLDLYDNRIEKISGLSNLINLRVLMLGKNRIQKIENLENLIFLDILDLHGNLISKIENLNNLKELRVLNIAANEIKIVENLSELNSLVELNLRRNKIEEIKSIENLQKLQRLFLSHNQITTITWLNNMNSNIQELTLDNNPIYNEQNYRLNVLYLLNTLRKLDTKRVTDNEKKMAYNTFARDKSIELETLSKISARIQDAENDWIMKNQIEKSSSFVRDLTSSEIIDNENENDYENVSFMNNNKIKIVSLDDSINRTEKRQNNYANSSILNSSCSSTNSFKDYMFKNEVPTDVRIMSASSAALKKTTPNQILQKRLPAQNICSTVQQDNTMLFYGIKSMEILDVKIDQFVQNQITTLSFHFIDYDDVLSKNFLRLKNKFPNTLNLVFTCCNIKNLNQLYALLDWKRLDSVTINKEDNPVESISFLKYFLLNHLNSLHIKKLNNNVITRSDACQKLFSPFSNLLFNLPDYKLMVLFKKERKKLSRPVQSNVANDDDDICNAFKNEHNNNVAREQMIKNFGSICHSGYLRMVSLERQSSDTENDKMSTKNYSQNFVNSLLKQMNHNDSRKKKFNQIKNCLWTSFVEKSINDIFNTKAHVETLCEQYKIIL